ncbi:MAG: hypothetical protein PUE98_04280 [Galactobacillus timonensis]|uniref:hypothetical protein n=1 Tax=Galactobacillus timonensis TaxID=2041840 RepID=UPI002409A224|nr:hypothetical protein [Galactobacillus timonensis]MDD6599664.1 hypothetical protein [Galactobacillus timonensis]
MIGTIIFFLILCSGSVWGGSHRNWRFEEVLPVTCSCVVLFVFLLSLVFHNLLIPLILLLAAAVFCYADALYFMRRNHKKEQFLNSFFTRGFFFFLTSYILAIVFNYGRLATGWDEFSHWMDIVKIMTQTNQYGSIENGSLFPAYVPGMAIFQYLLEKLVLWFTPKRTIFSFAEWAPYAAFQSFFIAQLLPWISSPKQSNGKTVICFLFLLAAPLLFFQRVYQWTFIDPILSIVSGSAIAAVYYRKDDDPFLHDAWVLTSCAFLTLAKDAGMLFAAFTAIAWILQKCDQKNLKQRISALLLGAGFTFVPRLLWNLHLSQAGILSQSKAKIAISFPDFVSILQGTNPTYRQQVWSNYWSSFRMSGISTFRFGTLISDIQGVVGSESFIGKTAGVIGSLGTLSISFSYQMILIIELLLMILLLWLAHKKDLLSARECRRSFLLIVLLSVVYLVGLVISYLYNFSEQEALMVASFERYVNILCQCIAMFISISFVVLFLRNKLAFRYAFIPILAFLILLPMDQVVYHLTRASVRSSYSAREGYESLSETIKNTADPDSRIYYICLASGSGNLKDYLVFRYNVRPIQGNLDQDPYAPDGEYGLGTPEEWMTELERNYDYVAVYYADDVFTESYRDCFENQEILQNTLYSIDRSSHRLIPCQS